MRKIRAIQDPVSHGKRFTENTELEPADDLHADLNPELSVGFFSNEPTAGSFSAELDARRRRRNSLVAGRRKEGQFLFYPMSFKRPPLYRELGWRLFFFLIRARSGKKNVAQ